MGTYQQTPAPPLPRSPQPQRRTSSFFCALRDFAGNPFWAFQLPAGGVRSFRTYESYPRNRRLEGTTAFRAPPCPSTRRTLGSSSLVRRTEHHLPEPEMTPFSFTGLIIHDVTNETRMISLEMGILIAIDVPSPLETTFSKGERVTVRGTEIPNPSRYSATSVSRCRP